MLSRFSGPRPRRGLRVPRVLLATDVAGLLLGSVLIAGAISLGWLLSTALFVVVAAAGGFYRSRLTLLLLDDLPGLLGRLLASAALGAACLEALGIAVDVAWWRQVGVSAVLVALGRAGVYAGVRWARRTRRVNHPTIIVGSGTIGTGLAQSLIDYPEYGLRPVAFYDPDPLLRSDLPVVGRDHTLAEAVRATGARAVILAFSSMSELDLVRTVRECARMRAEIFYVPRLFDLHSLTSRDIDEVRAIPVVRLRRAPLRSTMWHGKRVLDVVVSLVVLAALAPLLAVIAVLVRLFIGRPVLFRQRRISIDNGEFVIFKFRTLPVTEHTDSDTRWVSPDRGPGRLGAFLRMTSLDELPQLWNVLRGDMSLVGPRPERVHFAARFSDLFDHYDDRHRVPAGLTGLAQISGLRGDTPIDERARFDNAYVERWSLGNDIKIMLRTFVSAWRWRGQ